MRAYDTTNTEFLDVLIELERKDVVSQHAVQKYLTDMWIGGLKWSAYKFILLFLSFLIMPLVWVYVSSPFAFNRLHRVPIIKFMSYLAAHIFFIILITYTIVFPATKIYECVLFPSLRSAMIDDLLFRSPGTTTCCPNGTSGCSSFGSSVWWSATS